MLFVQIMVQITILKFNFIKMFTYSTSNLLPLALSDIVSNIEIRSDFCIYHPNYQPYAIASSLVERFQKISEQLQHKYLGVLLRDFLYGIYYNGSLQNTFSLSSDKALVETQQNLENNTMLGINPQFYQQLHNNNHGIGNFEPGWEVLRYEVDGSLAVKKGGLTLHIDKSRHLKATEQPTEQSPQIGDYVAVKMPKNRLQNGFYVAVSNLGLEQHFKADGSSGTTRIYFHLNPDGAIAVMDTLTEKLNNLEISFSFKTLYNPVDYKRYDSAVLYFERDNYPKVAKVLEIVYKTHQSYFQPQIPLFTKFLAPGLSLAEEPDEKFEKQESFGMNRCQIVANALLEAWLQGDNSADKRMNLIQERFVQHEIDLQHPYLNPSSIDIYNILDF
jgi:HopA1 effector protein family